MNFDQLIAPELAARLAERGITEASPIQAEMFSRAASQSRPQSPRGTAKGIPAMVQRTLIRPPMRPDASSTVTVTPARRSTAAADRPATPAPTTTTPV